MGTAIDVVHYATPNIFPLNLTDRRLPVAMWTCQCQCDHAVNVTADGGKTPRIVRGRYCSLRLTEAEGDCVYECMYTPQCEATYEAWQSSFVYSSYPNTYTEDYK